MADKRINDLPVGGQVQNDDLFVIQRNGTAYSVKGEDVGGGGGGATWGSITGTLSNQTDLNTALTNKASQTDLTATQNSLQALWLLNEGQTYDIHDVTQSAYENIVGAGCKWDTVKMVGGKSVVMNQLVQNGNFADASGWSSAGDTYGSIAVSNNKCTWTCSSTPSAYHNTGMRRSGTIPTAVPIGHKIFLSADVTSSISANVSLFLLSTNGHYDYTYASVNANTKTRIEGIKTTTHEDNRPKICFLSTTDVVEGVTLSAENFIIIDLTQMFGSGNEPSSIAEVRAILPASYYAYNTGEIKSALVDKVVVRGANFFGGDLLADTIVAKVTGATKNTTNKTVTYSASDITGIKLIEGVFEENTRYTFFCSTPSSYTNLRFIYTDGTNWDIATSGVTVSASNKTVACIVGIYASGSTTLNYENCGLMKGVLTTNDFLPYIKTETNIPASIQALDGYGRSAGTVYNYVDYDTKTYHKRVGSVDLGSLNWSYSQDTNFYTIVQDIKIPTTYDERKSNILCQKYNPSNNISTSTMDDKSMLKMPCGYFHIKDSSYTDATAFKQAMNGVMLYYELATEVVTDISDLIPNNFLKDFSVEEGGSITLHNTNGDSYRIPVPNTQGYGDGINRFEPLETDVNNINEYLGFVGSKKIMGVGVDFENRTFTRLAGASGKTAGASFNSINAFGGRRRCNVADNGTINAYYGDASYTEDGSNGQVMVYQPKFYYKVTPMKYDANSNGVGYHLRKANYYVCDTQLEGFKLHPAFIVNGTEVNYILLSAYEGSTYDVSESAYNTTDAQTVDWTNDKLASIANAKPTSGLTQNATRAGFRTIASNRGTGWSQQTIQSISASQLLFLVEYASLNTQTNLGKGVVRKTDDGSTNMAENTGATSSLGNASGMATGADGFVSISYRGEENLWGNIWKWIDGINLYPYRVNHAYIADHSFADNIGTTPYKDAGFTLAFASGYISAFGYSGEEYDWLFLPSECSGTDTLPVGDYFWQYATFSSSWLTFIYGGSWSTGTGAGGFCLDERYGSAARNRIIGSRLLYIPTAR